MIYIYIIERTSSGCTNVFGHLLSLLVLSTLKSHRLKRPRFTFVQSVGLMKTSDIFITSHRATKMPNAGARGSASKNGYGSRYIYIYIYICSYVYCVILTVYVYIYVYIIYNNCLLRSATERDPKP